MAIDDSTRAMMNNWAVWRICREQPGISVTNAYSLVAPGGGGNHGPIILLNDEAFEVDQAVLAMPDYLRQAVEEYWIKSEPVDRKARRCHCPVRTFWRRLQRAHQSIVEFRRAAQERRTSARQAYERERLSVGR